MTLLNCQNAEKKSIQIVEKDFCLLGKENDSIAVELNLSEFNDWKKILERTEQIVCNDSLPKVTLKNDSVIKRVYLRNPCWEGLACILVKQKNVIEIHNDTINKADENFYPLDSLPHILKRDLENNGKKPRLSDNPEKLLICISYDKNGIEKLPNTLSKLTTSFEQVTNKKDLKIWLNEKIDIPPPPTPPKEPVEIELIEDEK
ncbi:MAG: hypothetical protein HN714_03530 [Formosa sp.]|nr:hypothetical protein [Formosa sp.]